MDGSQPSLEVAPRMVESAENASAPVTHPPRSMSWAPGRGALPTLAFGVLLGALVATQLPAPLDAVSRGLIFWDTFVLVMLARDWWIIWKSDPGKCRERALGDDPGSFAIFLISTLGTFAGLGGAIYALHQPDSAMHAIGRAAVILMVGVAVLGGWLLMQTAYTLHYARLYYADPKSPGGIDFHDGPPDDFDFAYFAFTLGMTFQVSDLVVTDRVVRREILRHALISFFYNIAIFALLINIIAGKL
jgi:uncharacterized membrane protein